jgi:hypothetical protein
VNCIRYGCGYKYQLRETYSVQTAIRPAQAIHTEYIDLSLDGLLTIREGYAWDGPSGPTVDTPSFMRGSLGHDALYQLLRMGLLPHSDRALADLELRKWCLEDGMWKARAWWVYHGVDLFADFAADPADSAPDVCAPIPCALAYARE